MEWIWTPQFEFHNEDYVAEEDQTEIFAHAHLTRYVPPFFLKYSMRRDNPKDENVPVDVDKWIEHFE